MLATHYFLLSYSKHNCIHPFLFALVSPLRIQLFILPHLATAELLFSISAALKHDSTSNHNQTIYNTQNIIA